MAVIDYSPTTDQLKETAEKLLLGVIKNFLKEYEKNKEEAFTESVRGGFVAYCSTENGGEDFELRLMFRYSKIDFFSIGDVE